MESEPGFHLAPRANRALRKTVWLILTALLALLGFAFWYSRDESPEFFSERAAYLIGEACVVTAYLAVALIVWIALRAFYEGWTGSDSATHPKR